MWLIATKFLIMGKVMPFIYRRVVVVSHLTFWVTPTAWNSLLSPGNWRDHARPNFSHNPVSHTVGMKPMAGAEKQDLPNTHMES